MKDTIMQNQKQLFRKKAIYTIGNRDFSFDTFYVLRELYENMETSWKPSWWDRQLMNIIVNNCIKNAA